MKLELKIVDLLARNRRSFTINEIAKELNQHYSFVNRVVIKLNKENIIELAKAGKAYLCNLNLYDFHLNRKNEKTFALLYLAEIEKREELYKNKKLKLILEDFVNSLIDMLRKDLSDINDLVSIVLFGSYAKGVAKKESDIDLFLVTKRKISIEKITREIFAKYGKVIAPVLLTPEELNKQKDEALIKEIINNHYILYGVENFVNSVFK